MTKTLKEMTWRERHYYNRPDLELQDALQWAEWRRRFKRGLMIWPVYASAVLLLTCLQFWMS